MSRDEYLTSTVSTCGTCRRLLPARVHVRDGAVWFQKICPEHGAQEALVSSDSAWYLAFPSYHRAASTPLRFQTSADKPCPTACGLCPRHEQHVCLPIVEITDHCDLHCPICLVENRSSFHRTREEVAKILDGIIQSEGQIDVLNLSGGEPTLNPQFLEIVEECLRRDEVLRVSVSTHGLNLVENPRLLERLADLDVVVSLQLDALDEEADLRLRGQATLDRKLKLIEVAATLDLSMSLTATVAAGFNERSAASITRLLFEHDHILSAMFQPVAHTGRCARLPRGARAVTIPDVIRSLDGSHEGTVSAADFSPLPCSHPACFALAFYLRVEDGGFVSVKRLLEIDRYMDILENRAIFGTDPDSFESIKAAVYDLWSGPAALAPDSKQALRAVKRLVESIQCCGAFRPRAAVAIAERSIKSIFIHSFMDPHTFDLSRVRKCCNVYPDSDGRLVPACVRNCLGNHP
jgi:uncharacterized radical SAM superfamily Fe-S cluster-containing enzyme